MEKFTNQFEERGDKIHTKQEILAVLSRLLVPENAISVNEKSDDKGITMLDMQIEGEKSGKTIQYEYIRKGKHEGQNVTRVTGIDVVYYNEDGIPTGGDRVAEFDEERGEWNILK